MKGKILRVKRLSAGLTQQRLADLIGLPRPLIDYFERSMVEIGPEVAARLTREIRLAARYRK